MQSSVGPLQGMFCSFVCRADSEEQAFCASTLPSRIPSVRTSHSRCVPHEPLPPLPDGEPGFLPQLVPGTVAGKGGPPGFPTLHTLQLTSKLKMAGVDVLGQPSKRESVILTIEVRPAGSRWLRLLLLCLAALHRALMILTYSQPSTQLQSVAPGIFWQLIVKCCDQAEAERWV